MVEQKRIYPRMLLGVSAAITGSCASTHFVVRFCRHRTEFNEDFFFVGVQDILRQLAAVYKKNINAFKRLHCMKTKVLQTKDRVVDGTYIYHNQQDIIIEDHTYRKLLCMA